MKKIDPDVLQKRLNDLDAFSDGRCVGIIWHRVVCVETTENKEYAHSFHSAVASIASIMRQPKLAPKLAALVKQALKSEQG